MNRLITARTHYYAPSASIVMAVTISGMKSEESLKIAIDKAIQKHEVFSNKIVLDESGDSFYIPIMPKDISLVVRIITSPEDFKLLIREQERIPFDLANGELIRFFLLKSDMETKLVIIANHLAGDGMAIIYLIRDIMAALENPNIEYEIQPIMLLDQFGYPKDSKLNPMIRLAVKNINRNWNKEKKVFQNEEFLEMFHAYWKDRKLEVLEAIIDETDLEILGGKCKEHQVSVNSVISAAFLIASGKQKVGMAVSVRPVGYEGMGNYASATSIQYNIKSKKTFWESTKQVHKLIHKKLNKKSDKYFVLQFLNELEPTLIDASYFSTFAGFKNKAAVKLQDWVGYNEKDQISVGISNLAKPNIPSIYGSYTIEKIEFVPPLLPVNKYVVGIVTINNKMIITMQYPISEDYKELDRVFQEAVKILKGLESF